MDVVRLRKRVVELQEQLSSCIQAHGGEVSSLKNEITSLTLSVEQREAENQRLQLNVANLQRDLREVEEEKRQLQEDSTRNDEVLNMRLKEMSEKCLVLQKDLDSSCSTQRTDKEQFDRKVHSLEELTVKYREDIQQLQQANNSIMKSKMDTDKEFTLLQDNYTSCQLEVSRMRSQLDDWSHKEESYQQNLKEMAVKLEEAENMLHREQSVLRDTIVENESLKDNVRRLEIAVSEEKSCRQTIEKVTRQHQAEATEKQKKIKELLSEIHRLQSEMKMNADRAHSEIRKRERLIQVKVKELNHKSELCTSLKTQLDDITDAHDLVKRDLCEVRTSHTSAMSSARGMCLKMLGQSWRGDEGAPSDAPVLEELQQCCSLMKDKDQLIFKLERHQTELESQLLKRKKALDTSEQNITKMHSAMDALRQEMNDVSSKIDFAEETIGVQSHELETLKMKLDQSVLENRALRKSREESDEIFKLYLNSLGKKLSHGLSTGASVLTEETLVQTQNELSDVIDLVVNDCQSLRAEVERLQNQLTTADSRWAVKLREVVHRQRAKTTHFQDKIKFLKEKESRICDKLRSVSIAKETLISRAQKLRDTVWMLSRENATLQCLLVLSHGALFGCFNQIQQLVLGKSLLLQQLHYLQQFQDDVRGLVCSLRKEVVLRQPISKFRSAVVAVIAVHRLLEFKKTGSERCTFLSCRGIPLKHLRMILPGDLSSDVKSLLGPHIRAAVMRELQPTITSLSGTVGDPSPANLNSLLKNFSQSLMSEAPIFCGEGGDHDMRNPLILAPSRVHSTLNSISGCWVSSSQQITLSLRSTVEQLLHDLHTVRQEYKKLESLAHQTTVEKNELLLRMQYLESLEVKLEHSQKTLATMVSPGAHRKLEDEFQKALQRESEEQHVITTQAQHLQQLEAMLNLSHQELSEKNSALDEAVKSITDVKTQLASKEQSVKYLERSIGNITKERRSIEKRLKSLEQTIENLNSDKACLLDFITKFQTAFVKMDKDLSVLGEKMSQEDFCPSSVDFHLDLMAVSKFPVCQSLQEMAHKTLIHATTRISSLQREVALCQSHVQSLRQELQEVYTRTEEQHML